MIDNEKNGRGLGTVEAEYEKTAQKRMNWHSISYRIGKTFVV